MSNGEDIEDDGALLPETTSPGNVTNYSEYVVHNKRAAYDVYIGRDSKGAPPGASFQWGNPFTRADWPTKHQRLRLYREYIMAPEQVALRIAPSSHMHCLLLDLFHVLTCTLLPNG